MRPPAVPLALFVALVGSTAAAEDARLALGRVLFEATCQECHGPTAQEGAGGDIRGMMLSQVERAIRGFEQMPAFDLTEAELSAIVAYLGCLAGR